MLSLNEPDLARWRQSLHHLEVWTNTGPVGLTARPQFESELIQSNSPQAELIATAIATTRATAAAGVFRRLTDLLATPELTLASPWLQTTSPYIPTRGLTDRAYEIIPAQLLSRLRPDPVGEILPTAPIAQIRFSGLDGFPLTLETSTSLTHWQPVATNTPSYGFVEWSMATNAAPVQFFRARHP